MKTLEALTQEDLRIVNSARIVKIIWFSHHKNDKLTIQELIDYEVGTEDDCKHLLDVTKEFVEKLGPIF